jgi:hypothetical protein
MTLTSFIYHAVAAIAMLCQVVGSGLISLLYLSLKSAPGTEPALLILQGIVAISWVASVVLGFIAWRRRSWLVATVPIASLTVLWAVDWIAKSTIHWYLPWGY